MRKFFLPFMTMLLLAAIYTNYKVQQFFFGKNLSLVITIFLFVVMVGWEIMYRYNGFFADKRWFNRLVWFGSTLFGIWSIYMFFSILVDVGHFSYLGFMSLFKEEVINNYQKGQVLFWINISTLLFSILVTILGVKNALSGPNIVETFIPVNQKLHGLQDLRIVQISDLHVGAIIREKQIENIVSKVNSLNPDMIFLTGDVADGRANVLDAHLKPLSKLRAVYGKFYVTGNHEYYWEAEEWVAKMEELGFTALVNENKIITFRDIKILIAGVTDVTAGTFVPSHKMDMAKAISSDICADIKILLSHNPRTANEAEKSGFDVQVSGHTHGGQFFPFSLVVPLVHSKSNGYLNKSKKLWLYVTPGTGTWGPVNRFGVDSEIAVIKFRV